MHFNALHFCWIFLGPGSSCIFGAEAELAGAARASLLVRHVLAEPCVWDLGAVSVDIKPLQRVGQQRRQTIPTVTPIGQVKSISYNYINFCNSDSWGSICLASSGCNPYKLRTVSNESLSSNPMSLFLCATDGRWLLRCGPVLELFPCQGDGQTSPDVHGTGPGPHWGDAGAPRSKRPRWGYATMAIAMAARISVFLLEFI